MASQRTAVVVHNPAARRAPERARLEAEALAMRPRGWDVEVHATSSQAETIASARGAALTGADAVLACGGDGTLNSVLRGVIEARAEAGSLPAGPEAGPETGPAVGLVPAGTGDVWAREAGIPRRVEDALAMLNRGARRRADIALARIGDEVARPFLLMCGVGLDALVVEDVDRRPHAKRRLGRAAFAWGALTTALRAQPVETRIAVDGEEEQLQLHQVIVSNTRLYGGVVRIVSEALLDDGRLDLVAFLGRPGLAGRAREVAVGARALRGGLDRARSRDIRYRRGAQIVIDPARPLPVQADGELIGTAGPEAPLALSVLPQAVTLIVGDAAQPLFGAPGRDGGGVS